MTVPHSTPGQLQREVPTGTLVMYGAAKAPQGWLACDGSAVRRSQYATLFGIIGTTYGAGDGSTTFNLPNMVSRFPVGDTTPGTTGGSSTHDHGITGLSSMSNGAAAGGAAPASQHSHVTTSVAALPPYLSVVFIIKT